MTRALEHFVNIKNKYYSHKESSWPLISFQNISIKVLMCCPTMKAAIPSSSRRSIQLYDMKYPPIYFPGE